MRFSYKLIRSRRRTISIEITRDAAVVVRAPLRASVRDVEYFLNEKEHWIQVHLDRQQARLAAHPEAEAREYIPPRAAYYAQLMEVSPTAIRFSRAKTRFGSCSAKDSITFSLRLMDYPKEAVDYVIVHELAHIRHKNHGKEFYRFVASILPDYRQREALLKR